MTTNLWKWIEEVDQATDFISNRDLINPSSLPKDSLPPKELIFRAYELVDPSKVKVVILGQDPYPSPGKATGLAFGMPANWPKINSSFDNIRKECFRDTQEWIEDLTLESWAKQGILLTNTRLTVSPNKPMSHTNMGWEVFTGAVLDYLNKRPRPIAFVLWGREARQWGKRITNPWHHKFEASHPCKFSARRSFISCSHFSLVNEFLERTNQRKIKWGVKK